MRFRDLVNESPESCPHCGGPMFSEMVMMEKKDACYYKVKASAKVWPSAYASGRLVQCRKKGAANYGNKSESVAEAEDNKCPPATQDITLNLKNRQKAIDDYGYGPLNPDLPNRKFWMAKVDEWNLDSVEEAQQSLCGNCAAFDQRKDTLDCIAQGIGSDAGEADPTIEAGDLGYCRFLKFKCAARRTCDAWVTGGPLADKEAQEPLAEKWSQKYKSSINCSHPKGFSQKAHCAGKKKHNESVEMEMVCEDCGMCETHENNQNLDEACWKGYHKEGMKELFGKRVPNCVKNEDKEMNMDELSRILELGTGLSMQARAELHEEFDLIESIIETIAQHNSVDSEMIWEDLESLTEDELYVFAVTSQPIMESEAWQKANNRDKTDGMSQKAVNSYRREHPGSKLKTAVTTKPSKLKKGSKASKRRKSYCSRSRGQMKMHSISCAKTPDKAICKARRRWNC